MPNRTDPVNEIKMDGRLSRVIVSYWNELNNLVRNGVEGLNIYTYYYNNWIPKTLLFTLLYRLRESHHELCTFHESFIIVKNHNNDSILFIKQ